MSRADYLAEHSRRPSHVIKITLDKCNESFGAGSCTATGVECYNTWTTCKDLANYDRGTTDIYLSKIEQRIPFAGCRPLLEKFSIFEADITNSKLKTARFTVNLAEDWQDYDIGMDPYRTTRTTKPATVPFLRTLLARSPNLVNRPITIYEGFSGQTQSQIIADENIIAYGELKEYRLTDTGIQIEATDSLAQLSDIEYPEKFGYELVSGISSSQTTLVLTSVEGLDDYEYLAIGEEIISYDPGDIDSYSNMITNCVRGAAGTTAEEHDEEDSISACGHLSGNVFDVLKTDMLIGIAEIDSGRIASDWDDVRDMVDDELDVEAILPKTTKLNKLVQELLDIFGLKLWQGEDQKIHITRSLPNYPGRSYHDLTDAANVVKDSRAVDLNDGDRITTVELRYDFDWKGSIDSEDDFSGFEIQHDADGSSDNGYQDVAKKVIPCRWLRRGVYQDEIFFCFIEALARRALFANNEAHAIVEAKVEIKDSAITTGDFAKLTTTALVDASGFPLEAEKFEIVRRKPDKNMLAIKMIRCRPTQYLLIAPDSITNDWSTAMDAEKVYGAIAQDNGLMSDGTTPAVIY